MIKSDDIKAKVMLNKKELSYDMSYRALISFPLQKELEVEKEELNKKVLTVTSSKKSIKIRPLKGPYGEKEKLIYLNPLLRTILDIKKDDEVSIKKTNSIESFIFLVWTEHKNELIVGTIAGVISGCIILFPQLLNTISGLIK